MRISDWSSDVCSSDLGADDDGIVAGFLLDEDAGGAGVALRRLGHRRRDPGLPPGLVRDLGEGVAAEAGDAVDLGAPPSGSHGLVGALAARAQPKLPPEDRLAQYPKSPRLNSSHYSPSTMPSSGGKKTQH